MPSKISALTDLISLPDPDDPAFEHTDALAGKETFVQMSCESHRWMPSSRIPDVRVKERWENKADATAAPTPIILASPNLQISDA